MHAWRNWLHCTGSTYGTWLRGDGRGWRARHHREHVDGDYRSPPPPGTYDEMLAQSRRLMKRRPVLLGRDARRVACEALALKLLHLGVELVDLCVTAVHFHVLARFTPLSPGMAMPGFEELKREARRLLGLAKKHSAHVLRESGLAPAGGVWAARCGVKAIRSRAHQLEVAGYVRDHVAQDAAVWSLLRAAGK